MISDDDSMLDSDSEDEDLLALAFGSRRVEDAGSGRAIGGDHGFNSSTVLSAAEIRRQLAEYSAPAPPTPAAAARMESADGSEMFPAMNETAIAGLLKSADMIHSEDEEAPLKLEEPAFFDSIGGSVRRRKNAGKGFFFSFSSPSPKKRKHIYFAIGVPFLKNAKWGEDGGRQQ